MPQVFKIGPYWVYFWANENMPLEPVHVHVAEGAPTANGTKIARTTAMKAKSDFFMAFVFLWVMII